MLEIEINLQNARVPVHVISLRGEIDSSNYKVFQTQSESAVVSGARRILIEMSELTYISSAGLRVIHHLFNSLRAFHRDVDDDELRKRMSAGTYRAPYLKVASLSPRVREAFELSGFDVYIEVHESVESALQSF